MHFLFFKYPISLSGIYVGFIVLLESTTNFMLNLDQVTQLGVVLLLSGFGGLVEFFRERNPSRSKKNLTSLPSHCASALGGGVVMALLSYRIVEVYNQPMLWLGGILVASIFGNMFLNAIGKRFERQLNNEDKDKSSPL